MVTLVIQLLSILPAYMQLGLAEGDFHGVTTFPVQDVHSFSIEATAMLLGGWLPHWEAAVQVRLERCHAVLMGRNSRHQPGGPPDLPKRICEKLVSNANPTPQARRDNCSKPEINHNNLPESHKYDQSSQCLPLLPPRHAQTRSCLLLPPGPGWRRESSSSSM